MTESLLCDPCSTLRQDVPAFYSINLRPHPVDRKTFVCESCLLHYLKTDRVRTIARLRKETDHDQENPSICVGD